MHRETHKITTQLPTKHPGAICMRTTYEKNFSGTLCRTWIPCKLVIPPESIHTKDESKMRFRVCFHLLCELASTMNVTEWQVSWNSLFAVTDHLSFILRIALLSKMSTYRLTYFNVKGRGEVPRLLFAKSGTDFEDRQFQYGSDEYSEFKAKTSKYCG